LARFVLSHQLLVVLAWVVLAVAGAATAQHTTSRLSTSFSFPGQSGYHANTLITRDYGTATTRRRSGRRRTAMQALSVRPLLVLPAGLSRAGVCRRFLAAADRGFGAGFAPVRGA
jgi:hypothetical protein